MKLYAHVATDGRLEALVAAPDGKVSAGLLADPALQVCEIPDHHLKGDVVDLEQLEELLKTHSVRVTPAKGALIRGGTAS
jgi:hypothetical protein